MARPKPETQRPKPKDQGEWELEGAEAILDLVNERLVVPALELEARISGRGYKDYWKVQPVQLGGARRRLLAEGLICEDTSKHTPAVTTIRIPYPEGRKREIERLRGEVRKSYRKYQAWTADHSVCGTHAERVLLSSLESAAPKAGLWVPPQKVGKIRGTGEDLLPGGLTLDATAHVLDLDSLAVDATLMFESKNIHTWIYPSARELWELLVKAAHLALTQRVLPILVCVRTAYPVAQMAKDVGFFVCQTRNQVFSPKIDGDFDVLLERFGFLMERAEGPIEPIVSFLTKTLRMTPPVSPPFDEDIEWYKRQVNRFQLLAPVILDHDALASTMRGPARSKVFSSFKYRASQAFEWESVRGY